MPAMYHHCIGGFRASALPLRTFPDRHVLCSFSTASPELERPHALVDASRIALYPTGRLYLFRFAPRATFRPSAPRTRASTLSTSGVPPYRQLRRLEGCLAVDGVNYTRLARHCQYPATTCRSSTDTHAPEAITVGNHTRGRRPTAAIRDKLRMASHSHLTVFNNALYREPIKEKVLSKH